MLLKLGISRCPSARKVKGRASVPAAKIVNVVDVCASAAAPIPKNTRMPKAVAIAPVGKDIRTQEGGCRFFKQYEQATNWASLKPPDRQDSPEKNQRLVGSPRRFLEISNVQTASVFPRLAHSNCG